MRFDDRLDTVLRQAVTPENAPAIWAQIVDLLAQHGPDVSVFGRKAALDKLHDLGPEIPFERRRATASAIAARCRSYELVEYFAADDLRIAAPILAGADIAPDEWEALVPRLSPPARSIARGRRDLPETARRVFAAFGANDLTLDGPPVSNATPEEPTQPAIAQAIPISALVDRIERWRKDRPKPEPAKIPQKPRPAAFRFEADAGGTIRWQEGGYAEAIIGLSLSELAHPGGYGADGLIAGAFAKRAPIAGGRLVLPDGLWQIAARPRFDAESGRFEGYAGVARQSREQPGDAGADFLPGIPADAARQLVHELGTPLNAIRGFSELIVAEMFGPVPQVHSERARAMAADARRLAVVVDEIDSAARLDGDRVATASHAGVAPALANVLKTVREDLQPLFAARGASMAIAGGGSAAELAIDERHAVRTIGLLAGALAGLSRPGEQISLSISEEPAGIRIAVAMPEALRGWSAVELYDSALAANEEHPDAPPVGLGYTLRLVAAMARKAGGRLVIDEGSCSLIVPTQAHSNGAALEGI